MLNSQLTLLMEIKQRAKEGSQLIILTHSPILLGMPGAEIPSFDDGSIHPCGYEETDSYQVTSMLCAQPRVCSLTGGNPVYPRPNQPDISESWDGASNDT